MGMLVPSFYFPEELGLKRLFHKDLFVTVKFCNQRKVKNTHQAGFWEYFRFLNKEISTKEFI